MPRGDKTPPSARGPVIPGEYTCKPLRVLNYNLLVVEITSGPQKGDRHLARLPKMHLKISTDRVDLVPGIKPYKKPNQAG